MWNWLRFPKMAVRGPSLRVILALEQLETRIALAGNLTAYVAAGNLIVSGRNEGAEVAISQPEPGRITLSGFETTINGSSEPVTVTGVTSDLFISFGGGDDTVTFDETNPIRVAGNLIVEGGGGNNRVVTTPGNPGSLNVGGSLIIHNLAGFSQLINLNNVNVNGDVTVVNEGGDALIHIGVEFVGEELPAANQMQGNVFFFNGPGNFAETHLFSTNVDGTVQIKHFTKTAIVALDSIGDASAIGGELRISNYAGKLGQVLIANTEVDGNLSVESNTSGRSALILEASRVNGTTMLRSGKGNDLVSVSDAIFGRDFQLHTGSGIDAVFIGSEAVVTTTHLVSELRTRQVTVNKNGEIVVIEIRYIVLKRVFETIVTNGGPVTFNGKMTANLGSAADTLRLAVDGMVTFKKPAVLDGQNGRNTAAMKADNLNGLPKLKHFRVNELS